MFKPQPEHPASCMQPQEWSWTWTLAWCHLFLRILRKEIWVFFFWLIYKKWKVLNNMDETEPQLTYPWSTVKIDCMSVCICSFIVLEAQVWSDSNFINIIYFVIKSLLCFLLLGVLKPLWIQRKGLEMQVLNHWRP